FCGEDAGRPVEALCLAALGISTLSMRPASIGPIKHLLRRANLDDVRAVMARVEASERDSLRPSLDDYVAGLA
ncbi:MAG: hypothetical protein QMC17_05435, partial [Paracoccaceae bacterium]